MQAQVMATVVFKSNHHCKAVYCFLMLAYQSIYENGQWFLKFHVTEYLHSTYSASTTAY